jgi:hypothetical protein
MVSLCVIFILAGTFLGYAAKTLEAAREVVLMYELRNLRLSLQLYRILNEGRMPEELSELYYLDYNVYINRFDKKGNLLDPFGSPYILERSTGRIRPTSHKYCNW